MHTQTHAKHRMAPLSAGLALVVLTSHAIGHEQPAPSPAAAPSVMVVKPTRASIGRELALPGTIRADEETDLFAKTSGYVKKVNVDIGSRVHRGDPLVAIDVPEMVDELRQAESILESKRANIDARHAHVALAQGRIEIAQFNADRAKAEADLSEISFTRRQELFEGSAISEQELDEARIRRSVARAKANAATSQVKQAESERLLAEAELDVARSEAVVAEAQISKLRTLMNYATITAPYDGVITQRHIDTGAFVRSAVEGATPPLLHIAKIDRLRMVLEIPGSDVASVTPGTDVLVELPGAGGDTLRATISRTAFALDPSTRTMRAEVDLATVGARVKPGMYTRARVQVGAGDAKITIPSQAIRIRDGSAFVLVVRDGVARAVNVSVGYDDGATSEIVRGLNGDEWVIIGAASAVADGVRVTASPVEDTGAAAGTGG